MGRTIRIERTIAGRIRLAPFIFLCAFCNFSYAETTEPTLGLVNKAIGVAAELLQSDNYYDRILGAGTLCDIGNQTGLEVLEEFATGADIVYQRSAIDTLIGVQHPNGIDLIYRLASKSPVFTQFLTQSLATNPRDDMSEFLLGVLQESRPDVQQHAMQALVHMNDATTAIRIVNEVVESPDTQDTTKAYGYYFLARRGYGKEVEERLLNLAASGDLNQREVVAVSLAYLESTAATEALETLQKSKDERVSLAALSSHAARGDKKSIDGLIDVIARGKSLHAEVGASALRRLPPELAHRLSVELFALNIRPNPGARLLESWRSIDWDASEVYSWGLAHDNVDVKMQTIWLVGQRQERDMLDILATYLDDDNPRIRGMAAWAIVHIAPEGFIPGTKV
jgi:HEAT repeat protein